MKRLRSCATLQTKMLKPLDVSHVTADSLAARLAADRLAARLEAEFSRNVLNRFEAMNDVELLESVRHDPLSRYNSTTLIDVLKSRAKGIYDTDDREDPVTLERRLSFYKVSPGLSNKVNRLETQLANARSVCVLIPENHVDEAQGVSFLVTQPYNVCDTEKFSKQPTCGKCTGFVVGDDIIMTAGHCVRDDKDAQSLRFVFDYRLPPITGEFPKVDGSIQVAVKSSEVYRGVKLIRRDEHTDWALVRVDRKITGRTPLQVRETQVADGERLYTIGYPSGLPEKVADNAKVLANSDGTFFTADLDTFGGNSGSPVFSENDNQVVGVLVRGGQDFKLVLNHDVVCYQVVYVADPAKAMGEVVTRTRNFLKAVYAALSGGKVSGQ